MTETMNVTSVISAHIDIATRIRVANQVELQDAIEALNAIKDMIEVYCENWMRGIDTQPQIPAWEASILVGRLYDIADGLRGSLTP